jgi:hypothetical protein
MPLGDGVQVLYGDARLPPNMSKRSATPRPIKLGVVYSCALGVAVDTAAKLGGHAAGEFEPHIWFGPASRHAECVSRNFRGQQGRTRDFWQGQSVVFRPCSIAAHAERLLW